MSHNGNGRFTGGYGNRLVNRYNQYRKNDVPFQDNRLLSGTPAFASSYNNSNFQRYLYMQKMNRMNKARAMRNVNVSKEDMVKYVIQPMTVNKIDTSELNSEINTKEQEYLIEHDKKQIKKSKSGKKTLGKYIGNKYLRDLWGKRTNSRYKSFLKQEHYDKKIESEADLLIHKTSKKDKNKRALGRKFMKLMKKLKSDNKQIDAIYSKSERLKHKRDFKYSHVYKYRIKHNAKTCEEMKAVYQKEQKKTNKEGAQIERMISMLMDQGDIANKKDKRDMMKKVEEMGQKLLKNDLNKYSTMVTVDDKLEKLRKKLGDKKFTKIMKKIKKDEDHESLKRSKKDISKKDISKKTSKTTTVAIKTKKLKSSNDKLNNKTVIDTPSIVVRNMRKSPIENKQKSPVGIRVRNSKKTQIKKSSPDNQVIKIKVTNNSKKDEI